MTTETPLIAVSVRRLWWLYAISAAAFLPAFGFYYTGEEGILPLVSLEMWYSGNWTRHSLFGLDAQHNPLFNWIQIVICSVVGWEYMLQAARSISIGSVIGTGLVLAWLVRRVTGDARYGAFAAVVYLTLADIALYRGWLAYSDPLFGLLVFSATACLCIASREQRVLLLAAGVLLVSAAVLVKAFTGYVFYATVALVLLFERTQRGFLLGWRSIALHATGIVLMAVWYSFVLGGGGQGTRMFNELLDKWQVGGLLDYAIKLLAYPLETFAKISPPALLAVYYGIKCRRDLDWREPLLRTALAVALLGFLPYWLAPESHTRYLVPLYPWLALVCALVIYHAGTRAITITVRWWGALLIVKLLMFLVLFPYYQNVYRGENYATTARRILERTAGQPLYSTNVAASGLCVAAYIAVMRLPAPPLTWPPAQWDDGFVIAYVPDPKLGQVVERYRLGGNDLYLLCRGTACDTGKK